MPCFCEDDPNRPKDQWEILISLARHHLVVENETEQLRKLVNKYELQLETIKNGYPDVEIEIYEKPFPTKDWKSTTYRARDGEMPLQSKAYGRFDWLMEGDYKHRKEFMEWYEKAYGIKAAE